MLFNVRTVAFTQGLLPTLSDGSGNIMAASEEQSILAAEDLSNPKKRAISEPVTLFPEPGVGRSNRLGCTT